MTLPIYGFLWTLYPFGGEILARAIHMNGSVDNMWTLFPLFQMPILSLIPLLLMKIGVIKKGKMDDYPFDSFLILSLIIKVAVVLLSEKYVFPTKLAINILGTFFAIYLPFLIRNFSPRCALCKKYKSNSIMILIKTFGQAAIIEFLTILCRLLFPNIPYLGPIYQKIIDVKYFGEIFFFFIMLLPMYSYFNMSNENNVKKFCRNYTSAIMYGIVGFIGIIAAAGGSKASSFIKKNLEAGLGKDINPVEAPITPIPPVPDANIPSTVTTLPPIISTPEVNPATAPALAPVTAPAPAPVTAPAPAPV